MVTEVGLAAAAGLNMASGLVIRKLDNGTWSAPSSLRYVGARGLAAGFDITDYVLILRTKDAVDKFLKPNCNFGGRFSLSVGAGVTAAGGTIPAMVYAYSRGLFVGLSLELGAFYQSKKVNKLFYGSQVDVPSLLNGQVKAPEKAAPLYKALEGAEKED